MRSNPMKTWTLVFFGAMASCAPQAVETDEPRSSQSFASQVEDVTGSTAFRPTRPSFDALARRTAIRLQNGQVLMAGGINTRTFDLSKNAELFDPVAENWRRLPPMHNEHSTAPGFLLEDGRALVMPGIELFNGVDPSTSGIPEIFDPVLETWTACEPLDSDIWTNWTTATLLADGRVLVTGGIDVPLGYFFDTTTLTWSVAPPMKYSRIEHTATLLADGRVLIAGGIGEGPGVPMPDRLIAEIFDPKTDQWSEAGTMKARHTLHLAHLLVDGRVMLLDGINSEVEFFDPSLVQWDLGPSFFYNEYSDRTDFAVATLPDAGVLLVGGYVAENVEMESLYYSLSEDEWSPAGKMKTSRDSLTAMPLKDGRVLITGGASIYEQSNPNPLTSAELYARDSSAWKPLPNHEEKPNSYTATRLLDGRVLLGGWSTNPKGSFIFSADTNTFRETAPMLSDRNHAAATLLADGRVMALGGTDTNTLETLRSVEIFDPSMETWSAGPSMNAVHALPVAALLANGRVLVADEAQNDSGEFPSPEVFDPQLGTWTTIETFPSSIACTGIAALPDGRAAVSGYKFDDGDSILVTIDVADQSGEELLMPELYSFMPSILMTLANGQVLVVSYSLQSRVGLFDPFEQQWQFLGTSNIVPPMAQLPSGNVLSANAGNFSTRSGILDIEKQQVTQVESPYGPFMLNNGFRLTPLLDGRILLTGEASFGGNLGAYVYGKAIGEPCAGSFECGNKYCVDGYCCNEACDDVGSCNACARSRGAVANGTCTEVKACAPYQCDQIDVLPASEKATCTNACYDASDCASGYVCNLEGQCEFPKNVDVDGGCAIAQRESRSLAAFGMTALLLAMSRLRRRSTGRKPRMK